MGKKEKEKQGKSSNGSAGKTDKKLKKLGEEIAEARKKMIKLLRKQAAMNVNDYELNDTSGAAVNLSSLFGDKEDLILVHNMGKACQYCTMWADGFSGVSYFVEKKAAFVLCSPDAPDVQKEFAGSRGWKFKTVSAAGTDFIKDMGYEVNGSYWPGVSVFHKDKDGKITRVAKDFFGPGDFYSAPFHFFDLLPENKEVADAEKND